MSHLPVLDLSLFEASEDSQRTFVSNLLDVCSRDGLGFFYLKNHGLSPAEIENLFQVSQNFFESEEEEKLKFLLSPENEVGYSPLKGERLDLYSNKQFGDPKESFNLPPLWLLPKDAPLPSKLRDHFQDIESFQRKCNLICAKVLQAFALALDIEEKDGGSEYFSQKHRAELATGTIWRVLHYPPLSDVDVDLFREEIKSNQKNEAPIIRAAEHTDYGSLTLLFVREDAKSMGLQVKTPKNEWIDVQPIPNHIVVNTGDLLKFWSNNFFLSTMHRVVLHPSQLTSANFHRYSIAYFCHPDHHEKLTPVPSKKIPPPLSSLEITAGEYLLQRLNQTHLAKQN